MIADVRNIEALGFQILTFSDLFVHQVLSITFELAKEDVYIFNRSTLLDAVLRLPISII